MYVDPLVLLTLVALLVLTTALAAVAFVRYRHAETIYEAYGHRRHTPPPPTTPEAAPTSTEERFVVGADFSDEPAAAAPPDLPEPELSVAMPHPKPPEPIALFVPDTPPVPQKADSPDADPHASLFYEYTAEGFVPIDPYEAPYLPSTPSYTGLEEWEPVEALLAPIAARPAEALPEEPAPRLESRQNTPEPAAEPAAEPEPEDGFVWL